MTNCVSMMIQMLNLFNFTIYNIYLDLSKAFDTLDHEILMAKLQYYGIHGTPLELVKSYLTNRKQYVEIEDTK